MSMFFADGDPAPTEDAAAGGDQQPTRPGRSRHRGSRWVIGVLAGIVALVVLALAAGASYVGSVSNSVSENLQHTDQLPPEKPADPKEAPRPSKAPAAREAVNYVLLGSDSLTGDSSQGRSDVLMVLHLAGDRKTAALISLPRDLYVPIPGHGKNKINAAYALGGTPLTLRTVEGLLGTRMDHVALVDFAGFIDLTEQLGGVTLNNPHPSVSQGYSFPTGQITISGPEALAYVRERKQLPRGDLDRAERQRLVVQAVLAKGLSSDVLLNPVAFNRFVAGLARSVAVDKDLTVSELRRTALSIRVKPGEIASLQAPVAGLGTSPDKQSIDVVDEAQMKELADALRGDRLSGYVAAHPEG